MTPFWGHFWTSSKTTLPEVLSQNGFQTHPKMGPKRGSKNTENTKNHPYHMKNGTFGYKNDPFLGSFLDPDLHILRHKTGPKMRSKKEVQNGCPVWGTPQIDPPLHME